MNAPITLTPEDEAVRLYSKPSNRPVDEIAPQHLEVHNLAERWGGWVRGKYAPATCGSVEGGYEKGGRDATPASTAKPQTDPKIMAFDGAWRLMVRRVPKHAECIWLYYVERHDPKTICKKLVLQIERTGRRTDWSNLGWFMNHSRSMVRNIMRELES